MFLLPVLTWAGLFYADSHWHSWHAQAAMAHHPHFGALAVGSIGLPAIMIFFTPFFSVQAMYASRRRREAAGAQLTDLLIDSIAYLERARRWQEGGRKAGMVQHLEGVASCVERDLVWELEPRREDVVLWFRSTLAAKAEAVRQLSRWVLTPKSDTREHLLEELVTLLAASVRDDLDSFPLATESRVERRRTVWLRFTAAMSSIFSAVVPGAVVWSAYKVQLLHDPWLGSGVIGSILWACVVVMGLIDPAYGEHLESVNKLSDALRGKGKHE